MIKDKEMAKKLASKLYNPNGKLRFDLKFVQKHLTIDEILWIGANCDGEGLQEKVNQLQPYLAKVKVVVKAKPIPHKEHNAKYTYKGIDFNRACDIIYYILHENELQINTDKKFEYYDEKCKSRHYYIPVFVKDGKLLDIQTEDPKDKDRFLKIKREIIAREKIQVIKLADLKDEINKFYKTKGKRFLSQYRNKQEKDFKKSQIFKLEKQSDFEKLYEFRNNRVKVKVYCKCGRVDFQSPKTALHFHDMLCKRCRRALQKSGKK